MTTARSVEIKGKWYVQFENATQKRKARFLCVDRWHAAKVADAYNLAFV